MLGPSSRYCRKIPNVGTITFLFFEPLVLKSCALRVARMGGRRMPDSRRHFLSLLGLIRAATACRSEIPKPAGSSSKVSEPPPGAPPAFGTAQEAGPPVSPSTFAEAEKLMNVQLTEA